MANLTNGADERAKVGDAILQPGVYDAGEEKDTVIGHLDRFVPIYSEVGTSQCRIANTFEEWLNKWIKLVRPQYHVKVFRATEKVNQVDCAAAVPVDDEAISSEVIDVGTVHGIKEAAVGMLIKKSGRSSGLTFSVVLATDVTCQVSLTPKECAIFSDQILAGPMSLPGDSGSLVLTEDNYAVGLLFAGSDQSTMFCRIDNVLKALNVTLNG
ncbi:MAG: hypothetical protein H6Q67_42 [Firmicutes bacterium]|nr:hypothetical protein [Bacillota bacterium]